jgi:FkbM family methyltransferase
LAKICNVVCVNWGTKYSPKFVSRLYHMVKKNTSSSFRMYCLTDKPDIYQDPIIPVKLEPGFEGWWNKMQLFKKDVLPQGEYLYFDLDVVIVDNIDCFFDFEGFGITRDFINPDNGLLGGKEYNSSIMRFTQDEALWNYFLNNQPRWRTAQQKISFFGDQNVISDYLNVTGFNQPFPDDWIWSFKVGSTRGRRPLEKSKHLGSTIPNSGKVCVFHGRPNPDEVNVGWVHQHWTLAGESRQMFQQSSEDEPFSISVQENEGKTNLKINGSNFTVINHWFWKQFAAGWEPQTVKFFKRNLEQGKDYLDIGGWVGPTAFIATALGARKVKIIEPNPMNFFHLLAAQFNNGLLSRWFLVNACVSDKFGSAVIGPIEGISNSSSATNIRDKNQTGASVIALKLDNIVSEKEDFSLIKIDIEGAEADIVTDLAILSHTKAAIWLSLHPPLIHDCQKFLEELLAQRDHFHFVDENNQTISEDVLSMRILSTEKLPAWGTKWGNLFEIGILPKGAFNADGDRVR